MGLFSKKIYVCERCGKEYEKRIKPNENLCDDCRNKETNAKAELQKQIGGYCVYASEALYKSYTLEEMQEILKHRNELLDKFRFTDGISRAELMNASENYKKLSDEEATNILIRVSQSSVSNTIGAVYSDAFFVPTHYAGMIVDATDVFAVGMTSDYGLDGGNSEIILCAVFTNDPYVPFFPMIYIGKKGVFELTKSKKGREAVAALFENMCPNLKYPVCDLKVLKKTIKNEPVIKGSIEQKQMLDFISSASVGVGIFNTKQMHSNLFPESEAMLDSIGYIQAEQVHTILKMDKMLNRNYWNKQIARLSK